jgi:putative ABC transport system permease protein
LNLIKLSFKNILSRPLSTTMSLILLTLGVGMMSFIIRIEYQANKQLENNIAGIDMVIGAKGSPLQLILSQFFHIDAPTGNISFSEFSKVSRHPLVEKAIPMSFGDSYEGYRIVGTNHDYPEHYSVELSEGSLWNKPMEAVIGHNVAQELKLGIGDTFFWRSRADQCHGSARCTSLHD